MFTKHNIFPQDHSGGYLLLTLKEVKNMVENTAGRRRPTPKYLREYETLLVRKEMDGCCLEVYMCGFAIYQTAYHYAVLRMEETGQPEYHSVTERDGCGVNTENMDWSIGVMICGEDRIEAEVMDSLSERQRQVFHMYYFQGMRQKEIANRLNIDQSTVSKSIKAISNKAKNFF